MCGIAGLVDLTGANTIPAGVLQRMSDAVVHRGPDEEGFLEHKGLGLASRRLSIIGLHDGRQPIYNEDRSIAVVYNGELFDYVEMREMLRGRGHQFYTHSDTEIIPHLWEDYGEGMFEHLHGQFAIALWDEKARKLVLARDRFGVRPLYWTRQTNDGGDWLLFGSEVKALLASGLVPARPDPRGIHHIFNFIALPGAVTCFEGVNLLLPGHFMTIQLDHPSNKPVIRDRTYFEVDFPDRGQEERIDNPKKLVDDFERVLLGAVERRLRADVPVVSYLSGGIDSSMVVALASKVLGRPIPTFTIRILEPTLDETEQASAVAHHIGATPIVVNCGDQELLDSFPRLIWATEGPAVDTTGAAFLLLAQEVHRQGYKVALTGEGSDEWLAGYAWYKIHRMVGKLDIIPGLSISRRARYLYWRALGAPRALWDYMERMVKACGSFTAFHDFYTLMATNRFRYFSADMLERLGDHMPYDDVQPNIERVKKWHPLNQGLYWGARIFLPGLLLHLKGDRVSMHSSVETRYPFLDEQVYQFIARLDPKWKLHGRWDKYLLRLLGERWLPKSTAWTPKGMFRAPLDSFFPKNPPAYIDQLLSPESLKKAGYFDVNAVMHYRQRIADERYRSHRSVTFGEYRAVSHKRVSIELGLVAVLATQLWHHCYIDDSLSDLPTNWAQQEYAALTGAR